MDDGLIANRERLLIALRLVWLVVFVAGRKVLTGGSTIQYLIPCTSWSGIRSSHFAEKLGAIQTATRARKRMRLS